MSLPRFSVRNPVTTGMLVVTVVVMGLLSLTRISLDMFPSFERPVLQVTVPYPDASPAEVERRIVRPLEEALGTVRRLETIRATASQNRGRIELEFQAGTNMDLAALEVRERVEQVRRDLPSDVQRIDMRRFSSDEQPVLRAAVSWDGDPARLTELVERRIEPALLQVSGVAQVEFSGLESREVAIELDQDRMRAQGVTIAMISQALSRGNQDYSAGELEIDGTRFLVRAEGQLTSVEAIERLPLTAAGVRLADVASVTYDFPERDFFFRQNGATARQAEIYKESDANIVEVSRAVKATLEEISGQAGLEGVQFRTWQDQSDGILEVLKLLGQAGAVGGALAVFMLFIFLRRITPTFIVAAAIPVSLIFAVIILYLTGDSLNIITLSGLMLAVGMLIDNAVVVVENIFRHREMGSDSEKAAMDGANEVGLAILSGTLTTIIVFTPLFFLPPNQMGTQFRAFGTSISFTMIGSLVIAFTLVPLLAVRLLRREMPAPGKAMEWLNSRYRGLLDRVLDHRMATAAFGLAVFAAGGWVLMELPRELMPEEDNRFIRMGISTPRGISVEERSDILEQAERILLDRREEFEITNISAFSRGNFSNLFMTLEPFSEGGTRSTAEISEAIQEVLPVIPGVEWRQRRGFGRVSGVQVRLVGESTSELARLAEAVELHLEANVSGLSDLDNSLESGAEEIRVRVDRRAAERQGLTSEEVAQAVSGALRGQVATRFRSGEREVDVQLALRDEDRVSISQMGNLAVGTVDGASVPLGTVADIVVVGGPQDIQRENRQTAVTVSGEISSGANREDVIAEVQAAMAVFELPPGYRWDLGRGFAEEQEQFGDMAMAGGLALILIYLILAALFESLLLPLIIYFSIFFAVPGLGLIFLLTGSTFSILSFLGVLITVGIVVNNSIVMIDLVNQLRSRGMERREALLTGCTARLRPILMTSLTTLFGLVPMAFLATEGMGQMFAPIGQAVIGGLTTSTILTLALTPTLYAWFDDMGLWTRAVRDRALEVARGGASGSPDPVVEGAVTARSPVS
ncbi:MAG: efflux RND transporter permease subunit [Gemmatimonadales bacterium]|nr:MAG: efflux RND transporter permease subunit [Gemmatimonadales bacterium]